MSKETISKSLLPQANNKGAMLAANLGEYVAGNNVAISSGQNEFSVKISDVGRLLLGFSCLRDDAGQTERPLPGTVITIRVNQDIVFSGISAGHLARNLLTNIPYVQSFRQLTQGTDIFVSVTSPGAQRLFFATHYLGVIGNVY